jgi:hypothetical protein
MGGAGHVARMRKHRNACRLLMGKLERKRPLGRARLRWILDWMIGFIDNSLTITCNHNQFTTARNKWLPKTRSILSDYDWLLFWSSFSCDWLSSDLRITHFRFTNELRLTKDECRLTHEWILLYEWMRSQDKVKVTLRLTVWPYTW